MKKTLISALVTAFAFTPFLGMIPTARAATMNTAIRGQSSFTVYWYANDGKRYPFPNAGTYFSWFNSFDQVQEVSDFELTSIPLANENVTYRPGAKLVKIQTSPMVYVVAKGGVLRHVTSESVARSIYGADWNLKVHDIPDVFFSNYTVGAPIYSVSDYNVSNEYNGVSYPHQSLKGNTNQNGTSANPCDNNSFPRNDSGLKASRTTINSGESIELCILRNVVTSPIEQGWRTTTGGSESIVDSRNSTVVHTCYSIECRFTITPTRIGSENSVTYRVNSNYSTGSRYQVTIYFNDTSGNSSLSFNANDTSIRSGDAVVLTANYNQSLANGRIEIKNVRNSSLVKTCYNTNYCSVTVYPERNVEGSTAQYIATVLNPTALNSNGTLITYQYGPVIYIDSNNNNASNDAYLSLTNRTNHNGNELISFAAGVTRSGYTNANTTLRVYDTTTGELITTCYEKTYCSFQRTFYTSQTKSWYVRATNSNGQSIDSSYLTFDANGFSGGFGSNALSVNLNKTTLASGDEVRVTASASDVSEVTNRLRMELWSMHTMYHIDTCYDSLSCTFTTRVYRHTGNETDQLFVRLVNDNGTILRQVSAPTIYYSGTSNDNGGYTNDGTNYVSDLRLETSNTSIVRGATVKLTVNAFNVGNWNYSGNRIEIRDIRNGNVVKNCYDQSWCVADVTVYQQSTENIVQYEARLYDRYGRYIMNELSPAIHFVN